MTDRDPEHKKLGTKNEKFVKCYPFEYNQSPQKYDYRNNSNNLIKKYENHPNIRFFSQPIQTGKTLEYDIAYSNPDNKSIITPSISNAKEITRLMDLYSTKESNICDFYEILRANDENERIFNSLQASPISDDEKKRSIIAARYLNSVGKGQNALELSKTLDELLDKEEIRSFVIPQYIEDALNWI